MSQQNNKDKELDPEIADLLGLSSDESPSTNEDPVQDASPVDISGEDDYYKAVLEGEKKEAVEGLSQNKKLFESASTKEDKGFYREKLGASYWNFYRSLAAKVIGDLSHEKLMAIRFNLLDLKLVSPSQLDMLKSIPPSTQDESIYYADEWFKNIAEDQIDQSVIDETITRGKHQGAAAQEKLERKEGQHEAEIEVIKIKVSQIEQEESQVKDLLQDILHEIKPLQHNNEELSLFEPYSDVQRESLTQMMESCKALSKLDRDLKSAFNTLGNLEDDIDKLKEEASDGSNTDESSKIDMEINSLKQMIKMTVGRQGNHFPILMEHYFTDEINQVATKGNVKKALQDIERLDPSLFMRAYKGEEHRVVPYIILAPCYGEYGICWDPIPRKNRATGKGRIAIPMFPKSLKIAMLTALADIRWQVAKEKAQHYWMEEGLTGEYYEYYTAEKLKGDIRRHFIQDYMLWITWESQGIQKLHKDVRNIFWRKMPFPQKLKEELKTKGYFYNELYQKDKKREESRGY